jgi:hypothetical protein
MVSRKKLQRVTLSLDPDDYKAVLEMGERAEVSGSWLVRLAIREFLSRYGQQGQPELALKIVARQEP